MRPFASCPSGCRTETCGTTLGRILKPADCNLCVDSNVHRVRADASSVARNQSRFGVLTLPRDCAWGFKRGMSHLLSSAGRGLTVSNRRKIFSLTSRAARGSTTLDSPASLVSALRKPPHLGSKDHNDGWPQNSSTSTTESFVSPRANRTCSLWGWSLLR